MAVSLLMLSLGIPTLLAWSAGASAPNPSAPAEQWAYGGQHWLNGSTVLPHTEYRSSAYFGWNVIYTLTNTSNTTFELEAQRTMAVSYAAEFCAPSCAAANGSLNLTLRGTEQETGFANLTTTATVVENGTTVPALGLQNAQSTAKGNLTESVRGMRTLGGIAHTLSETFSVSASAASQVSFTSPLGLIPWNVTPGANWNSSAAFTASGAYSVSYAWSLTGMNGSLSGSVNGSGNPSGSVNATGTVALMGRDLGDITLANGMTTPVIVLLWASGPFDGIDGVILVPHGFEIFSGRAHAWDGRDPGLQNVATSRLDLIFDLAHHRLRFAAAASSYTGSDTLSSTTAGSAGLRVASAGPSPALVQAQPESVPAAQASSSCLLGACGGASSPSALGRSGLAFIASAALLMGIVGVVGVLGYRSYGRRRPSTGSSATPAAGAVAPSGVESLRPLSPSGAPPPSGPQEPPRTF